MSKVVLTILITVTLMLLILISAALKGMHANEFRYFLILGCSTVSTILGYAIGRLNR